MVTFRSSIHWFSILLLLGVGIGLFCMATLGLWYEAKNTDVLIGSIITYFVSLTFLWMLLDTKYIVKNTTLCYYSGPIRGKIDIHSIRRIKHQKGWINESFLKPSLGLNGLYLYYNQYDDIYLSPKNKDAFVNYLLKINPKIDII